MMAWIFLTVLAVVVSLAIWRMRKAQAREALARHEAMELRNMQRKEAITTDEPVEWPTIIRTVSGKHAPGTETEFPEPSMSTIEFKPTGDATLHPH